MAHPFRQRMKGPNGYKKVSLKKSVGTFHPLESIVPPPSTLVAALPHCASALKSHGAVMEISRGRTSPVVVCPAFSGL
jgi:hypothetical protein